MNGKTLWELAQEWQDPEFWKDVGCRMDSSDCGKQLEQWARERAAQWTQNAQDYGQRNQRENEIAWAVTEAHVDDLGVPEER